MEWNGVQCWGRWGERGTEGGDRMGMGGGRREVEASGWGGRGTKGGDRMGVGGGRREVEAGGWGGRRAMERMEYSDGRGGWGQRGGEAGGDMERNGAQ